MVKDTNSHLLIILIMVSKTFSFALVHMCVAFTVGYLLTGSLAVGGALAVVEPMCNTVAYYFHEKVWLKIKQRPASSQEEVSALP